MKTLSVGNRLLGNPISPGGQTQAQASPTFSETVNTLSSPHPSAGSSPMPSPLVGLASPKGPGSPGPSSFASPTCSNSAAATQASSMPKCTSPPLQHRSLSIDNGTDLPASNVTPVAGARPDTTPGAVDSPADLANAAYAAALAAAEAQLQCVQYSSGQSLMFRQNACNLLHNLLEQVCIPADTCGSATAPKHTHVS